MHNTVLALQIIALCDAVRDFETPVRAHNYCLYARTVTARPTTSTGLGTGYSEHEQARHGYGRSFAEDGLRVIVSSSSCRRAKDEPPTLRRKAYSLNDNTGFVIRL